MVCWFETTGKGPAPALITEYTEATEYAEYAEYAECWVCQGGRPTTRVVEVCHHAPVAQCVTSLTESAEDTVR